MFDLNLLGAWLLVSILFLGILFFFKNGRGHKLGMHVRYREKMRIRKRKKLNTSAYLRHLRTLVFRPKLARAFFPLVILFIVVILLLNNFVYFAVITSDSMAPTFKKGDMVLMTQYADIEQDDIIMFTTPDEPLPVVHRIHNIEDDNITTKGDFNPVEDAWVINESAVHSEAVIIGGKPVVLQGVGNYFIEDYESHGRYDEEIEFNRLLLQGMKNTAIYIFMVAVLLYIYFTLKEHRERKVT
jgi:signal peptidase